MDRWLLGIYFWWKVREERNWVEFMGKKGGCLFGNPIRFAARQERKVNCFCASVSANTFDADLAAVTCHSAVVA